MKRVSLIMLVALTACGQQPEQPGGNTAAAAAPTPVPAATPAAPATLSRYAGQYPTDAVAGGSSFLADPAVRDAITSAVPDAAIRRRVLDTDVTATPIAIVDGRLLSHGCEPHNCGAHNWAIAIVQDGSKAAVCYFDQDRRLARWYPEGAGATPSGGCPSGD